MHSPLASVALFRSIPSDGLDALAERGRPRRFAKGDVLMRQGEPSDVLHVIQRGRVRVERVLPDEPVVILAELDATEVVGEMGLLDNAPRSATVTAITDTETLELDASVVAAVIVQYPDVATALLRTLSRRLRSADELAEHLARQRKR